MGTSNYSDDFKRDGVHQISVRGYPIREFSRRLGDSSARFRPFGSNSRMAMTRRFECLQVSC